LDRAYSDDEGIGGNVDLANEFREKYPYGKLRFKNQMKILFKKFHFIY
jgi:hypothetical protein